jgi:hypothetical protein
MYSDNRCKSLLKERVSHLSYKNLKEEIVTKLKSIEIKIWLYIYIMFCTVYTLPQKEANL